MIAVDPSSKASGGALLGDRVRIVHDSADEGSFVRSMAARDRLGGLADQTLAAMVVMRALFDRVLIETVGVGQSETDVAGVADTVVFCVQPGSGDSLQFMKAGIVEIPHLIVVTKADLGAAAERARADVAGALSLGGARGDWPLKTLAVSSRSGAGIDGADGGARGASRAISTRRDGWSVARHRQSEGWCTRRCASGSAREGLRGSAAWLGCVAVRRAPSRSSACASSRPLWRRRDDPSDRRHLHLLQDRRGPDPVLQAPGGRQTTIAFMDINPVNPGHALAVAKGHWPTVDVIPPEVLADVARTAQKVAKAAIKELKPARREPAAGQRRRRRPERAAPAHPHHAAPCRATM